MKKLLKKGCYFTDIHFGKKSNSEQHSQDCLDYLKWFCEQVKADPEIDYIGFLGDWHENRSSLNILTLAYSYEGASLLNDLGLPIYIMVGNHDLYFRHSRKVHSLVFLKQFKNFVIIEEPTVINEIHGSALFCPYMFHHEYPELLKHVNIPFWAGHFEFRGFVITGHNVTMPTGPDYKEFVGPKHIVSGHFHKRQAHEQVIYIGNAFPMDYGDSGDFERGLMTYDHVNEEMEFQNWEECPKYIKVNLSQIVDGKVKVYPNSRVKCIADVSISYEESNSIRQTFTEKYKLREFVMEESPSIASALADTQVSLEINEGELLNINDLMMQMLKEIDSPHIDNDLLIDIYKNIKNR